MDSFQFTCLRPITAPSLWQTFGTCLFKEMKASHGCRVSCDGDYGRPVDAGTFQSPRAVCGLPRDTAGGFQGHRMVTHLPGAPRKHPFTSAGFSFQIVAVRFVPATTLGHQPAVPQLSTFLMLTDPWLTPTPRVMNSVPRDCPPLQTPAQVLVIPKSPTLLPSRRRILGVRDRPAQVQSFTRTDSQNSRRH